jgi:PhzF family phenazine biosynthesis protein
VTDDIVFATAFADGPGGGNPCPIVFGADGWPTERMRALAEKLGHETAFVLPPRDGGDVRLRYFVPLHEMEMCVHATVATVVHLAGTGRLTGNPAAVETPLGVRAVTWDAGSAMVEQFPPVFGPEVDPAPVLAALRIAEATGPIRSVSTARAKLMVPVADEDTLDAIEPDHELLWDVCDRLDVTGFYPYAVGERITARQFPRRAGYPEDPATGVAACALGAHLAVGDPTPGWHRYTVHQGRAMGRPSLVIAESLVGPGGTVTATRVGGRSVTTSGSP